MTNSLWGRSVFAVLTACVLGAAGTVHAGGPGATASRPLPRMAAQIIVRLADYKGSAAQQGISDAQMVRLERAAGVSLRRVRNMSGDARVLALPGDVSGEQLSEIVERISGLAGVVYVVPDRILQAQAVPNDPLYTDQWHYSDPVAGIEAPNAWDITTGDPGVYVAVIDTGILGNHEDLAGRWTGGYDFIFLRFNANDGDGRDPDPSDPGDYLFPNPSSWHGSHVAGTIGAATDNGIGVAGINWESMIVPVRVLGRLGGFTSDVLDGTRWAAGISVPNVPTNAHPADVINISLGGGGSCGPAWQSAVDDVVAAGATLVVAAGNENDNAANHVPANCDDVITVGAVDRTGDRAWYSNYGPLVEISAPGGDTSVTENGVLSTVDSSKRKPRGDAYAYYQGTSMASPHVAGVVSLLKSVNPSLTPAEILGVLQSTAKPFPARSACAGNPTLCGAGIVDAEAALLAVLPR